MSIVTSGARQRLIELGSTAKNPEFDLWFNEYYYEFKTDRYMRLIAQTAWEAGKANMAAMF